MFEANRSRRAAFPVQMEAALQTDDIWAHPVLDVRFQANTTSAYKQVRWSHEKNILFPAAGSSCRGIEPADDRVGL